jgi:hypothetical protein
VRAVIENAPLTAPFGPGGLTCENLRAAAGASYRPDDPIVAAAMKQAVDGFHVGDDPWLEYLRSTGRHIAARHDTRRCRSAASPSGLDHHAA